MTDYRFLAKRTDAFIELLSEALIGWNTCFTVKETDDPYVYSIKVRDLYWNREISFGLNIRFWMIRGFDANEKVDFQEMLRISNSIQDIMKTLKGRFDDGPKKAGIDSSELN